MESDQKGSGKCRGSFIFLMHFLFMTFALWKERIALNSRLFCIWARGNVSDTLKAVQMNTCICVCTMNCECFVF